MVPRSILSIVTALSLSLCAYAQTTNSSVLGSIMDACFFRMKSPNQLSSGKNKFDA